MNRREFIKTSIFAGLGTIALGIFGKIAINTKKIVEKVSIRKYLKGKNESISLIGYDTTILPTIDEKNIDQKELEKIVDYEIKHGVNFFDTGYCCCDGLSEGALGKALSKYPRDSFYLSDKMPINLVKKSEDVERIFNEELERCKVSYFDFYLIHYVHNGVFENIKKYNVYEQLIQKKKEGKIKYLGFSFFGVAKDLKQIIDTYKWDFVQLQMNVIDEEMFDIKELYDVVSDSGLQVIAMNPLKDGQLVRLGEEAEQILLEENYKQVFSSWTFRYLVMMPNILTILCGTRTYEEIEEFVETFINIQPLSEKEKQVYMNAIKAYKYTLEIPCISCKNCKVCPKGIEIPKIFLIYNQYKGAMEKWRDYILFNAYNLIPKNKRADKCINCGLCKKKCSQNIDIPKHLKKIDSIYKKIKDTINKKIQ